MESPDSIKHRPRRIKREKGDGDEEEVVKEEERLKRAWRWETGRRRGREGLERGKSGENG